jgi:hypothetical protein
MTANRTVRNRGYGLIEESCLFENSECLAVPVRRGGRGKLKDGWARKSDTDPVGNNWVVNLIASMLVLRTFLIKPGNL